MCVSTTKQHGIEGSPNDLVVAQTTRSMLVNKIVTLFHAQRLSPSKHELKSDTAPSDHAMKEAHMIFHAGMMLYGSKQAYSPLSRSCFVHFMTQHMCPDPNAKVL